MSFRYRLALFLVVTLAAVQILTAAAAYFYLRADLLDRAERNLTAESHIFARQLNLISERVSTDVEILSLDYALRRAIAQRDYATELSALRNHGHRIGATRMMLVGLDGAVAADTGSAAAQGRAFPYVNVLGDAASSGENTTLVNIDGRVYWMATAPVLAPVPIAFIAAYIPVDDALLEKFKDLSISERSIALATADAGGKWRIVGRTANAPDLLPYSLLQNTARKPPFTADNGYLIVADRLPTPKESRPVVAILTYPISELFAAYRAIVLPVLAVLALALIAAAASAFLVVRRAARPLEALAGTARRIAQGDYTIPTPLKQNDEIGQLSHALAGMTASIAEREAALTAAVDALEIARREAVAASEAKSQFLANVSHELRTPLNAILGFGEMLHQQVLGPLGAPRYGDYARDICSSGRHLLTLVMRLLDVADIEAGQLTIAQEPFDGNAVLSRSAASIRLKAEAANVRLSFTDNAHAFPILGDAAKLEDALTAILDNAVKFTPAGGSVSISTVHCANSFIISVRDSGIGIRAEDVARVTRPFHRLRRAFDGQHQGVGVGLPYAKAVATLHGGSLTITSEPGRGTNVEITLPKASLQAGEAA